MNDAIEPHDPAYRAKIGWLIIEMVLDYFNLEFATRDGSCINDVLCLQPSEDETELH